MTTSDPTRPEFPVLVASTGSRPNRTRRPAAAEGGPPGGVSVPRAREPRAERARHDSLAVARVPRQWVVAKGSLGLGNRMRALCSGISLARASGRGFAYVWPQSDAFAADLTDLWEVDAPALPRYAHKVLQLGYPNFPRDASGAPVEHARRRVWLVCSVHAPLLPDGVPTWEETLRTLEPAPAVSSLVRDHWDGQRLGADPYVGVQMRLAPDAHVETQKHSPFEWYVARMHELTARHPDLRFFVSSDVPEAQRELVARFPRCSGLTGKGAHNSLRALQHSVADLYLLASSAGILAPHNSSFAEMAVALRGPGIVLETSLTDGGHRVERALGSSVLSDPLASERPAGPLRHAGSPLCSTSDELKETHRCCA